MSTSVDLDLRLELSPSLSALQALDVFEHLVQRMAITPRTWSATDTGQAPRAGGFSELRSYVIKHSAKVEAFGVVQERKVIRAHCWKQFGPWNAKVSAFTADEPWMQEAIGALRDAVEYRGLESAELTHPAQPVFAPHPPIAKACYAVLTTDAQVTASYDDPTVFWESWDKIEPIGKFKLCTRALTALTAAYWLGETFENTMAMVRAAKPKLTGYTGWYQPTKANAPWWHYGDVQDEKAGWPLLDFVGYDPKTRTLEYAAKPNHPGHLLLQEIMTLMNLVDGKTRDGQPIEVVRVVFLDEKQARAEKRPLLDNDIKVYYLGKAGELVELTS
jgi:hypothetical protein